MIGFRRTHIVHSDPAAMVENYTRPIFLSDIDRNNYPCPYYKTATRMSRYRNELLVEKKVNELKLQFFTNISHEIRTPLTLIISPIEDMLSTIGISARNRTLMEIIHKNAKRMLHLTSQLLDFQEDPEQQNGAQDRGDRSGAFYPRNL